MLKIPRENPQSFHFCLKQISSNRLICFVSFRTSELWMIYVGIVLLGLSLGPMMVPGVSELENIVKYVHTNSISANVLFF